MTSPTSLTFYTHWRTLSITSRKIITEPSPVLYFHALSLQIFRFSSAHCCTLLRRSRRSVVFDTRTCAWSLSNLFNAVSHRLCDNVNIESPWWDSVEREAFDVAILAKCVAQANGNVAFWRKTKRRKVKGSDLVWEGGQHLSEYKPPVLSLASHPSISTNKTSTSMCAAREIHHCTFLVRIEVYLESTNSTHHIQSLKPLGR